jgi:competence protein CoiA
MQLYALDNHATLVAANHASRLHNYFCIECRSLVRVRGGIHRQKHYYHLDSDRSCRLRVKSMEHLQTQCYIQNEIGIEDCSLECRFPEINRIADVVWHSKNLIFEIQCSPITADEVNARNADYRKKGFQVIWILHDKRYNQKKIAAMEMILRKSPYYYTNIDTEGIGFVYDQFDVFHKGMREDCLYPLKIDIKNPIPIQENKSLTYLPLMVQNRIQHWPIYFTDDLISRSIQNQEIFVSYLSQASQSESKYFPALPNRAYRDIVLDFFFYWIVRPYYLFFQMLLEKACK